MYYQRQLCKAYLPKVLMRFPLQKLAAGSWIDEVIYITNSTSNFGYTRCLSNLLIQDKSLNKVVLSDGTWHSFHM